MTWRELLIAAGDRLKEAGIEEYEIDAWYLFSEAFEISRAEYFLCRDQECGFAYLYDFWICDTTQITPKTERAEFTHEEQFIRFRRMIELRSRRIPLQQITGHQEFMGLDFKVNEHVLCPRQDTEVLVETVLNELPKRSEKAVRILDLCAGSGCIGISLERLSTMPVDVLAADISDDAIAVAVENAKQLGCERYHIVKSDLFELISGTFEVIVSNPPYIPSAVIDTLEVEVRLHEPRLALDGEADGLIFYRRISAESVRYLAPGGQIYYEIGHDQGQAVSDILAQNGFADIRVIRDLAGLDRVVAAKLPGWRTVSKGQGKSDQSSSPGQHGL